ncbi:hypothetical protein Hanom_Chr10g00954081 [Helianthus anomalus]
MTFIRWRRQTPPLHRGRPSVTPLNTCQVLASDWLGSLWPIKVEGLIYQRPPVLLPAQAYCHIYCTARAELRVVQPGGSVLYVLSCMGGHTCALHHCLAQWFAAAYHRHDRSLLYRGCTSRVLPSHWALFPRRNTVPRGGTVEPTRLARQTLIVMHNTRDFPGLRLRFIGAYGQLFVPVELPDELLEELPELASGDVDDADADGDHAHPPPLPPQPQGVPPYPQHVLYDQLPSAVALGLQQMEGKMQVWIDAHHARTDAFLMRAIQVDIQAAIERGRTPLSILTLSPRPGQEPGSSGTT